MVNSEVLRLTFQDEAGIADGFVLCLPHVVEMVVNGDVEFIEHSKYLLSAVTLPGSIGGECG